MKYIEIVIVFVCWILAGLWFKSEQNFSYEALIAFLLGTLSLIDSLRRFGFFGRLKIFTRKADLKPWSHTGGKVDKTDISLEIVIENNTSKDTTVRNIELFLSERLEKSIGENFTSARTLDVDRGNCETMLPLSVAANTSKTIYVEKTHDASSIEKYTQAERIGKLEQDESCYVCVNYCQGRIKKEYALLFKVETSAFSSIVRSWYEEANDHRGVVKIIEKT